MLTEGKGSVANVDGEGKTTPLGEVVGPWRWTLG
jgi:hypothetical protein